jgi:hypothetical protein
VKAVASVTTAFTAHAAPPVTAAGAASRHSPDGG